MLNRIDNVKPLSVPRMHGRARRHTDQLLTLIGEGSDADDVLSFFRELWPEVEGADRTGASASPAEVAPQTALEQEHNNGCGRTGAHQQVALALANCTAEVKEVEAYGDIWNTAANMPHFLRHPVNRLAFQTWSKDSCCFRACKWLQVPAGGQFSGRLPRRAAERQHAQRCYSVQGSAWRR